MIKSLIAALLIVAAPLESSAGFVTGYVAGSSGSNTKSSSKGGIVVEATAVGRDVIACHTTNGYQCWPTVAPAVFAGKAGYKTVHRVVVALEAGRQYIVMEVSR